LKYNKKIKDKVMTVQELINELNTVKDKSIEVVIQGTDPTNYIYYNEVEDSGCDEVFLSEFDDEETKVFIIDGGMF
jgi:hypothetical protein